MSSRACKGFRVKEQLGPIPSPRGEPIGAGVSRLKFWFAERNRRNAEKKGPVRGGRGAGASSLLPSGRQRPRDAALTWGCPHGAEWARHCPPIRSLGYGFKEQVHGLTTEESQGPLHLTPTLEPHLN